MLVSALPDWNAGKKWVAGGVIAVLPGQLGIGVFSPLLDARGNSVRGIQVCDALSRVLDLHLFNLSANGKSVIRLRFSGKEVNSQPYAEPGGSKIAPGIGRRNSNVSGAGEYCFFHL